MSRLEKIKDEVATEKGYRDWSDLVAHVPKFNLDKVYNKVKDRYQQELSIASKEAQNDMENPPLPFKKEAVNHPKHYGGKDDPYEAIKVIEAWELDFHLGNTVKYISRAGKKDKTKVLEDLKKARWYLDRYIEPRVEVKSKDKDLHNFFNEVEQIKKSEMTHYEKLGAIIDTIAEFKDRK